MARAEEARGLLDLRGTVSGSRGEPPVNLIGENRTFVEMAGQTC